MHLPDMCPFHACIILGYVPMAAFARAVYIGSTGIICIGPDDIPPPDGDAAS